MLIRLLQRAIPLYIQFLKDSARVPGYEQTIIALALNGFLVWIESKPEELS